MKLEENRAPDPKEEPVAGDRQEIMEIAMRAGHILLENGAEISRESWLTAATRFRWAPLTGMCCTLAKNSSLWFPMVEKIPLLRTNEFADWIP